MVSRIVVLISLTILSAFSFAESKNVNSELVKNLRMILEKAEAGKVSQMFIVMTGDEGVSFSYSAAEQGELVLIGGVEWAKRTLIEGFDARNKLKIALEKETKK